VNGSAKSKSAAGQIDAHFLFLESMYLSKGQEREHVLFVVSAK
jgi:hypothetical protein